jgi:hypothetical protein
MTRSERDVHVEERAYRILKDDHTAAVHAAFVDYQLRYRWIRHLLARVRALAVAVVVMVAILPVGIFGLVPGPLPAESTRRSGQ